MKNYIKSIALAGMFTISAGLTQQFSTAQSASSVVDCGNKDANSKDCPPVVVPNPPPPPAPAPTPPAPPPPPPPVVNPPPPVIINPPPPIQTGDWRYDPRRHHRHDHGDAIFRFSFGGFFYDQPYWQQHQYYQQSNRISCGEGRSIVADNGYNRVRTIECNGTTFTCQARRGYRTYRIFVNSRRGTISGVTRRY